jgi:hypothetical protein
MLLAPLATAQGPLAAPADKPILTVSGKIAVTNKDQTAQFDRPMMEALGFATIETATPWYKGRTRFEGVPLAKVLEATGATGQTVSVAALNDYSADLSVEEIRKYNVILAMKRDGEYMTVRDKGPLFVIFPFDSDPALMNQKFYGRSVWQVTRIEVK